MLAGRLKHAEALNANEASEFNEVCDRVGIQPGYKPPIAYVIITKRRKQAIGEITEEDAKKEGFAGVEEFKQTWVKLYGNWKPKLEVWVYDFVLERDG